MSNRNKEVISRAPELKYHHQMQNIPLEGEGESLVLLQKIQSVYLKINRQGSQNN